MIFLGVTVYTLKTPDILLQNRIKPGIFDWILLEQLQVIRFSSHFPPNCEVAWVVLEFIQANSVWVEKQSYAFKHELLQFY